MPGLEDDLTPGSVLVLTGDERQWGLAVRKDLDFPGLVRDYRDRGAVVLLAPSWDFHRDGWLHGRIAITRGVESGVGIVRPAREGTLTISDYTGRVLAEAEPEDRPYTTVIADLPVASGHTLYARLGDWFAWLDLLLLAGLVAMLSRPAASSAISAGSGWRQRRIRDSNS